MINPLKFFLKNKLKRFRLIHKSAGFTLIEVLVAIVISSIIVGTLLSFMKTLVNSERQEQAKAITEQETQTALDYIAQDLEQAVYIYDATGIAAIKAQLPYNSDSTKVPVLVFWKRNLLPKDRNVTPSSGSATTVGCLVQVPGATTGSTQCDNRDYFVYSLVAYYLVKDNSSTWSSAARIGRWEIQDGIRNPYDFSSYLTDSDTNFQLFDLSKSGSLAEKMNLWQNASNSSNSYNLNKNKIEIIVDYVDQSTGSVVPALAACSTTSSDAQQVPANSTTANPLGIYSFSACVDSSKTLAQVYLRGNALARIKPGATYNANQSTYFPTANVQVKSQGVLGS